MIVDDQTIFPFFGYQPFFNNVVYFKFKIKSKSAKIKHYVKIMLVCLYVILYHFKILDYQIKK